MSRTEKAMAAFGSVIAVTLLYLWQWSVLVALAVFVVGVAITVSALRLTHPYQGNHYR